MPWLHSRPSSSQSAKGRAAELVESLAGITQNRPLVIILAFALAEIDESTSV